MSRPAHITQALVALCSRETVKFMHQPGRLASAVVRPSLWLLIFAAGLGGAVEVGGRAPYAGAIDYQTYVVPGLLAMVLLFNGMQSSLSMVYDREMGLMRLLLTAPLPRSVLLACKLAAGTLLSLLQAYVFLLVCALFGVELPWWPALVSLLPALLLCGAMLGAVGLLLSVYVRQLENFAGTMNFVIFPMFFVSPALYPLARFSAADADIVRAVAGINPFSHAVELIRFAAYGQLAWSALAVVAATLAVCFTLAVRGYDPQRGFRPGRGG